MIGSSSHCLFLFATSLIQLFASLSEAVALLFLKVRTILDNTRLPALAADVPHHYNDKYLVTEFVVCQQVEFFSISVSHYLL